jgi:hypothetical protein
VSRSCTKVCMGGAVLEIRRERGYCSEKGCVCVWFVRDCFVFF